MPMFAIVAAVCAASLLATPAALVHDVVGHAARVQDVVGQGDFASLPFDSARPPKNPPAPSATTPTPPTTKPIVRVLDALGVVSGATGSTGTDDGTGGALAIGAGTGSGVVV